MMRDIRDRITAETQDMTLTELKKYLAEKLNDFPLKTIGK